jgi:hypothetical protein
MYGYRIGVGRWPLTRRMAAKLLLAGLLTVVAVQGHAGAAAKPADGTLVRGVGPAGSTPVAVIVGGAPVPLADRAELEAIGHRGDSVKELPLADYQALPRVIADGTYLTTPGGGPIWVVQGGRRSLVPADQIPLPEVHPVPARALNRIPVAGPRG